MNSLGSIYAGVESYNALPYSDASRIAKIQTSTTDADRVGLTSPEERSGSQLIRQGCYDYTFEGEYCYESLPPPEPCIYEEKYSLIREFVDVTVAETACSANASVVRTIDELTGYLIDMVV